MDACEGEPWAVKYDSGVDMLASVVRGDVDDIPRPGNDRFVWRADDDESLAHGLLRSEALWGTGSLPFNVGV